MLGTTNASAAQAAMANLSITLNGANGITYNGKAALSLDITAAKVGAAAASHSHSYLPLSGGTMTGNITYKMYNSTWIPLKIYGGNADGQGICLCAGASTIVGSGESGNGLMNDISADSEDLHLGSDYDIMFHTNGQTWSNAVKTVLNRAREFYPWDNGTGSIGTSSNRWKNGYFNSLLVGTSLTIYQPTTEKIADSKPSIIFTNSSEGAGTQQVWIKYSDFDIYKVPAGLTICGQQGKEYLIVDGDIKTNKGILYTTNNITFEQGTTTTGGLLVKTTLPLADGTKGNTNRYPLKWFGNEQFGIGIKLGDGGCTVVGAGESADSVISALSLGPGTETLFLTSDGGIRFIINCNDIGSRTESSLSTSGEFVTRYLNATHGYKFNGTAGKISAVQSGAPNTNMVWMW